MPFENFYEESDKTARRWWKIVGIAFLLFIGYWVFGLLAFSSNESSEPQPKITPQAKTLTIEERRQRVNEICANLPKPEEFYLVDTEPSHIPPPPTAVFYGYRSDRNFDEIMPAFIVWFDSNGWKRVAEYDFKPPVETQQPNRQLIFSKERFIVNITYYYPKPNGYKPSANYQITCSNEEISLSH